MNKLLKLALTPPYRLYKKIIFSFRKPKYASKVFCIGYNKTGTTTLGKSLEILGYNHSSFNKKVWRKLYRNNKIVKILQYTAKYDSFDDLPWLKEDMIPILDKSFPNSKFVYLNRDEASWQKSMHEWSFKITGKYPDLEKKLEDFRNHKKFVLNYFKDRPSDQFLMLDIRDEKGFKKLADFLGKTSTQEAFPHYNKTSTVAHKLD